MIEVKHFQIWILLLLQAMELLIYVSAIGFGHLSVLQPTIFGRNITLQLNLTQPLTSKQFANCILKVMFDGQTTLQTINSGFSRFDNHGMNMMELDKMSVNRTWDNALIHLNCSNRVSNTAILKFQDEIPVLGPLCAGKICTECVCVQPGDTIRCITSSTNVALWIGNRRVKLQNSSVDSLHTYIAIHNAIKEDDHKIKAFCSAAYDNNAVFNASSFVYVYIPPKDFKLFVPELLEDNQVNITCIAQRGRPPSMLEIYLDGENITGVSQHDVFDENTSTYTSVATFRWANRNWNNKNITCRLLVRNPDGKYVFEKSTSTQVTYRYRPEILHLYVDKTCGNSEEVCLTCFVRGNPPANISLGRSGQDSPIIECMNTTECSINISKSGSNSSEYECMASNVFGTARQTIVMYEDLKELRRRREIIPNLIPLKVVSGNTKPHDDLPVATAHPAAHDDSNEVLEASGNTYSNIVVSTTRREAHVAVLTNRQPELVYADIDIAYLESKQKTTKKTNTYVPTEYASVRELTTAVVPDEQVYANT